MKDGFSEFRHLYISSINNIQQERIIYDRSCIVLSSSVLMGGMRSVMFPANIDTAVRKLVMLQEIQYPIGRCVLCDFDFCSYLLKYLHDAPL